VLESDAFTSLIADTPLANEVDLYVAREIAAMLTLVAHEHRPLRVYAPVSKRLIADVRTEQYLWEIADAFSLQMQQLCLQIDRALFDSWTPALRDALASLHDAGVRLVATAVTDAADAELALGHGIDELHLTPELARVDASTVGSIVEVAHARDARVAATGVADEAQRDALTTAGCDFASGSLFGEPAPCDTIE
jgi:EAL domain-containing protein (putative c-di-GMP-specific phosphodiesterase class I)